MKVQIPYAGRLPTASTGLLKKPTWFILSCPRICAHKGRYLHISFLQSAKKRLLAPVMPHRKEKLLSRNDLS